jgi:hypothetical protein
MLSVQNLVGREIEERAAVACHRELPSKSSISDSRTRALTKVLHFVLTDIGLASLVAKQTKRV